jgi:hypothetical protein
MTIPPLSKYTFLPSSLPITPSSKHVFLPSPSPSCWMAARKG